MPGRGTTESPPPTVALDDLRQELGDARLADVLRAVFAVVRTAKAIGHDQSGQGWVRIVVRRGVVVRVLRAVEIEAK